MYKCKPIKDKYVKKRTYAVDAVGHDRRICSKYGLLGCSLKLPFGIFPVLAVNIVVVNQTIWIKNALSGAACIHSEWQCPLTLAISRGACGMYYYTLTLFRGVGDKMHALVLQMFPGLELPGNLYPFNLILPPPQNIQTVVFDADSLLSCLLQFIFT